MSILNSGCSHKGESPTLREPDPPANSDSDSGHLPEEDPGDTSAQGPAVLSLGPPHLDTSPAPSGPGLCTLLQQLPPQDSDERYCLALEEEELAELRLFCAQRRREALGQGVARLLPPKLEGHTCEKCRERLRPGEYGVFAARAGEQRCWHRPCFACQACGQALINLIYFYHNERLYCGRHHAELLKPRCPACDQLIFSQRCTEAEGRRWHENHFCCQDCAGPLGGGRYALPGGGPCCPSCFKSRYSDAASSLALALEGREPLGGAEPGWIEGGDRARLNAVTNSRAALLAAAVSSSPETQRGRCGSSPPKECRARNMAEAPKGWAQRRLETPSDPKEDALCPTCSSSSDSEPDGFFLGQRLPRPGETPGSLHAGSSDPSGKPCIIC
ncbi:prickle-like protein 4 [Loxodonta africana]|uniref:prickle-like protein 4 n=1 Tax=Loxodonta africana TaxID=9785 RepID=UPI0030CDB9B6